MPRPEHTGPPELFYDARAAEQYTRNTHVQAVQERITARALQILGLPPGAARPCLVLDVGCGSGLSSAVIAAQGHLPVGVDVSPAMLALNPHGCNVEGDIGEGLPFAQGCFDGCIGISVLQWLCYSNRRDERPFKRLFSFFQSLYACLKSGATAVFQIYPESQEQLRLMEAAAMKAGFSGGTVVDFPNSTRAKKFYLTLFCGRKRSVYGGEAGDASAAGVTGARGEAPFTLPAPLLEGAEAFEAPDAVDAAGVLGPLSGPGEGSDRWGADGSDGGDGAGGADGADPGALFVKQRQGRAGEARRADVRARDRQARRQARRPAKGSREWILYKKVSEAMKGKDVKPLTKYSGRRRKH